MDEEAIRCPRCDEGMQSYLRRGPRRAAVTADMCDGCGGVWLDGKEVEAVYPAFGGLADRIAAAPPAEGAAGPIAVCPRERFDAALADYQPPTEPLVDLSFFADVARGLPVVLGAVITYQGSCSTCRCSRASRCRC